MNKMKKKGLRNQPLHSSKQDKLLSQDRNFKVIFKILYSKITSKAGMI